jgi:two-component system, LuxR family, sensor kinase FixL
MSYVTIIWSMVASACLTLAAMHLLVWCRKRTARAHLLFSLTAAGTAGAAFCELWLMRAQTAGEYGMVLRWGHVPYWVMILSLVGFVRLYMRAGRLWLAWTVCGLRTLSLILDFVFTPNINYREITALRHVRFLGESVSVAVGIPNPWMLVGQTSLLLFLVFLVDVALTIWRRGERRSMLILSICMVFFIATGTGQFVLGFWGIKATVPTPSLFFLGVVAVMAWEMSRETIRAGQLSDDLRKSEEWLDLAADSAGVGLWLWDFRASLIWATEKARALYGFPWEGPIPFAAFISKLHPDDRDWVVQASQKCLKEGADFRHDYRIVMPDGGIRWFRVLAKAFKTPSGEPERMAGVSLDITERKQADQNIAQQRGELAHIARVFTMSQLSSSLAHELNQPLGAILRNAEAAELLLQDASPDLDEVRAILGDIRKDDQRAGNVIDRLRALLKRRSLESEALNIDKLIDEVTTLVRFDAAARGVKLEMNVPSNLPPVRGDRVQLQQVLLNLILNGMDAVSERPNSERHVTIGARLDGDGMIEVVVSDSGQGVPPGTIDRLFEPFFTTKPHGMGMGLAISRTIVEAHGGRVRVENNSDCGATFRFTLPAAEAGGAP